MDRKEDRYEIVKSILALSRSLKMTTIAEGVEKKHQLEMLADLNCDFAQGYLFARPMPEQDLLGYVAETVGAAPYMRTNNECSIQNY